MAVAETSSSAHDVRSMALYLTRLKSSSNASQDSWDSVSLRRLSTSVLIVADGVSKVMASRCSTMDAIGAVLCLSHDTLYRFESSLELVMGTKKHNR